MELHISYLELNRLLAPYIELPIAIISGGAKRIAVKYRYETEVPIIGKVSKNITIKFDVFSVCSDCIWLQLANGWLMDKIVPNALKSICERSDVNFMLVAEDRVRISLTHIPSLAQVLDHVILSDIIPTNEGLKISFSIKN